MKSINIFIICMIILTSPVIHGSNFAKNNFYKDQPQSYQPTNEDSIRGKLPFKGNKQSADYNSINQQFDESKKQKALAKAIEFRKIYEQRCQQKQSNDAYFNTEGTQSKTSISIEHNNSRPVIGYKASNGLYYQSVRYQKPIPESEKSPCIERNAVQPALVNQESKNAFAATLTKNHSIYAFAIPITTIPAAPQLITPPAALPRLVIELEKKSDYQCENTQSIDNQEYKNIVLAPSRINSPKYKLFTPRQVTPHTTDDIELFEKWPGLQDLDNLRKAANLQQGLDNNSNNNTCDKKSPISVTHNFITYRQNK